MGNICEGRGGTGYFLKLTVILKNLSSVKKSLVTKT